MIKIDLSYRGKDAIAKYQELLQNSNENWIQNIYAFLVEWYNENDFIELKTSGSTGVPKNILMKKSAMIFSATQTLSYFNFDKGSKFLLCLPAEFIGGKMMILRALIGEMNLYAVEPKLNVEISNESFHFSAMIPLQVENYLKNENSSIDKIIIGGASISNQLEKKIQNQTKTHFWATYGMTETVSHIALRKINGDERNSSFIPMKNILIGKDERQCLTIYNKNYSDDVIITNDIAEFDSENHFTILGRWDNIINSGGLKIIPEELENEINLFIENRSMIIGLSDDHLGQKVVLLIEGEELDPITLNLLKNNLKDKLGKKCPKEIYFMPKFVETDNGKLNRGDTIDLFNKSL